jgi:hypothetical protein
MKKLPASTTLGEARKAGRLGDSELVHLNPVEVKMLENMTGGHGLTINPQTGEREAFLPFLLSMLPTLFPTLGASLGLSGAMASPLMLGALGSGLGTWAETGDLGKGVLAGLGGAALGGLGGKLLGGAAAGALGQAAKPAIGSAVGQAAGQAGGEAAKAAIANTVAKGAQNMGSQAVNQAAGKGLGGMMAGLGNTIAPMIVGAPGAYLTAEDQMDVGESDRDLRRKAAIERAQHENFMGARTLNAAPGGYRHGMDREFNFFGPGGTLTPVTTTRGYAAGGMVGPQVMPLPTGMQRPNPMMPVPRPIGGRMPMAPANQNLGVWGGLQLPPRQTPTPYDPMANAGGRRLSGGGGTLGDGAGSEYTGGYNPMSGLGFSQMSNLGGVGSAPLIFRRDSGVQQFAEGGMVMGPGDGVSDSVPAMINGAEPAALSDGEFVIPAMAVAKLGNGSSKAGAEKLQQMVDSLLAAQ